MALKLFNTLSRSEEVFTPINPDQVTVYACGPTVYNHVHIGNWRSFLAYDVLIRTLTFLNYNVKFVMNITDVDDKIIRSARKANQGIDAYTKSYIEHFKQGIKTLNIRPADEYPKATEHITEMIQMIEKLLDNGYAYETEGSIFYRVDKFEGYGKLALLDLNQAKSAAKHRIINDEYDKESISDFCLWKAYKPEEDGDVFWDAPFGKGRPGWHIECSAMSIKHLGESIDIHTGGVDLIFPHHTNEIAQSEGSTHRPFVKYWIHPEHLVMPKQDTDSEDEIIKMSKSLGNIIHLDTLMEKGWSASVIRLALISANYRTKLIFSTKILEQAKSNLDRVQSFVNQLKRRPENITSESMSGEINQFITERNDLFINALEDGINMPEAIAVLFQVLNEYNPQMDRLNQAQAKQILTFITKMDQVFGCLPLVEEVPDKNIDQLIKERIMARESKNYAKADQIRKQLNELHIIIEDTPQGTVWRREI